eukprot:349642-Chlamydomonas_euryale.AAC.8
MDGWMHSRTWMADAEGGARPSFWNMTWPARPQCHSCATISAPLACTASTDFFQPSACSSV